MKRLKAVPEELNNSLKPQEDLPEVYSIYVNGPITQVEEIWYEQELLIETLRWFQEFSICHQQDEDFARNCPLPHKVYGTVLGLLTNQLGQMTKVGEYLTHPRNRRVA